MKKSILFFVAVVIGIFFFLHAKQSAPVGCVVSVTTCNVGTLDVVKPDVKKVKSFLLDRDTPDILLLQELPRTDWIRDFSKSFNYDPAEFKNHFATNGGVAILSSYPVRFLKAFYFSPYGAVAAEVDIGNYKILVVSVHLKRIKEIRVNGHNIELSMEKALSVLKREITTDTDRTVAVNMILSWIAEQSYEHVLIGGDFNTVPFSKTIRVIGKEFKDTLWPSLDFFRGTYNESPLPIQPRTDFIFYSKGFKCIDSGIVRESAGDHYPVWAVFDPQISPVKCKEKDFTGQAQIGADYKKP